MIDALVPTGSASSRHRPGLRVRAIAVSALMLTATALPGRTPELPASEPAATPADGRALYLSRCAVCHGEAGDGQGPAAYLLYPRPRNFAKGTYRLRSTPSGDLPTDEDLIRTITSGIPGTSMPSWGAQLSSSEIRSIVTIIKSFSERFTEEEPARPIEIPPVPPFTDAMVEAGRGVYEKMQCGQCHGPEGRGDGPSAATLVDDSGLPIRAYDYTLPGRMKGGQRPEDIYRAFTTGLDGTPMPQYGDFLSPEERWQLVAFVASRSGRGASPGAMGGPIRAVARDRLPEDPMDLVWDSAPATPVELRPLFSRPGLATHLEVRAVRSGTGVALRLEWEDRRKDDRTLDIQDFRDAVAIQFPVDVAADPDHGPPFIGMGEPGRPVNVWQWKADWQQDLARRAGVRDAHPNMFVATYHGVDTLPEFDTARAAGNPMARWDRTSPVEDLNATGLGTLTSQDGSGQDVSGSGVHVDGRWCVVVRRALATGQPGDVSFAAGKRTPVAFAVWDGSNRDRDGQKIFSNWETLDLGD